MADIKITKDDRVFNIRLTRRELINLLIACSRCHCMNVHSGKEWNALHAKLKHYIAVIDLNDRGNEQ